MQEPQKLVRKGVRSVVFGPELTADSLAKRAMTGGPFCKLNGRHASSPWARSRLNINDDHTSLVPTFQASTEFGFATIVGGTPLRPPSMAPHWGAGAGKWRDHRSLTTPRTGATAPKRRAPARIK